MSLRPSLGTQRSPSTFAENPFGRLNPAFAGNVALKLPGTLALRAGRRSANCS